MAAFCRLLLLVWLTAFVSASAHAQSARSIDNPAEAKSYADAVNTKDATKRAQALEVFIAWYPRSVLRVSAYEQLMAAWHSAGNPAKADVAAVKTLQIDPDNVRALANRAYIGRTLATAGDQAALAWAVAAAERGTAVIAKWSRPASMSEMEFTTLRRQTVAVFSGVLGFAALQAKDYTKARQHYIAAVADDPDNLQDIYQYSVALLEGAPLDALGFWYGARAIAIARAAKNEQAAAGIDRYVRARYRIYHGGEEGWDGIVAQAVAGPHQPPMNFAASITRVLTPPERAVKLVAENNPGTLSYAEWELVLTHRDASAANRDAAERVWNAIAERQRRGEVRLKIRLKVLAAAPDRIEGAITDTNQASNTVDIEVRMARSLGPLPAVGSSIAIIGALKEYGTEPFRFIMSDAELAPESMPVAGGLCAEPRPQLCTRDYRPACGVRRDGGRKTYGNACSACADPEIVSQAAGACP